MAYFSRIFPLFCLFILWFGNVNGQLGAAIPDSLLHPEKFDSTYCKELLRFGNAHYLTKPEMTLKIGERVVELGDSLDILIIKAQGQYTIAVSHVVMAQPLASLQWLDSCEATSLLIPDSNMFYTSMLLRGVSYDNLGHYLRSLETYRKALNHFRRVGEGLEVARIANNIGNIYLQQEKFELALEHYFEARKAGERIGNDFLYVASTTNVGNIYLSIDSLDLAEKYFAESYQFNHENKESFAHGTLCGNLAKLRLKQGRLDEVEPFIQEALETSWESDDWLSIAEAYLIYGSLYEKQNEIGRAFVAYDSAHTVAVRISAPDLEMEALDAVYKLHEQSGDLVQAFQSYKAYNILRDSLFGEEKTQQLEELSAIHTMERREQEIDKLTSEREFQDRLFRQQNWFIGGLGGILTISLILLILVRRSERRRRKINQYLKEKNQKIADQQHEILAKNEILASQNLHLETLNSEMEGLVEIVAHDLKSPITKTQALIEMVEEDEEGEQKGAIIPKIKKVLEGGEELIQDILTIRRIESSTSEGTEKEVELQSMLRELAGTFSVNAKAKKIQIELLFPEESIVIKSFPIAIERIFENLISNALKFSYPGTTVTIALDVTKDSYDVSIQDQGPGISESDQKIMFRKFQRLSARPTAGESSTGLGLSIVDALVKKVGGKIRVKSDLGKGACFTVQLPK